MTRATLWLFVLVGFALSASAQSSPYLTDLWPETMSVGRHGKLSNSWKYHVSQILNDNEMMVRATYESRLFGTDQQFFWLKGVSTKELVDGKQFLPSGYFVVTGTKTYKTVLGAARTVNMVESETAAQKAQRNKLEAEWKAHLERMRAWHESEKKAQEKANAEVAAASAAEEAVKALRKAEEATKLTEAASVAKLSLCKQLIDLAKKNPDKRDVAKFRLQELIRDYRGTKAAEEAKELLKKL